MQDSLLVYDASRSVFRRVAARFTAGTTLRPIPWEAPPVQTFLTAQFGGRPFAFLLVEGDRVHAGEEAVVRVLRSRGLPPGLAEAVGGLYPTLASPVGRLLHGRVPADIDGSFALTDEAREALAPVRDLNRIPVE